MKTPLDLARAISVVRLVGGTKLEWVRVDGTIDGHLLNLDRFVGVCYFLYLNI